MPTLAAGLTPGITVQKTLSAKIHSLFPSNANSIAGNAHCAESPRGGAPTLVLDVCDEPGPLVVRLEGGGERGG